MSTSEETWYHTVCLPPPHHIFNTSQPHFLQCSSIKGWGWSKTDVGESERIWTTCKKNSWSCERYV